MPTSVPGKTKRAQAGLTLVELLVVLLIMGMVAGIVALAVPRGQSDVASASAFAEREIAALRDQAVTEVGLYGLQTDGRSLVRFRATGGQWVVAARHVLPGDVTAEFLLDEGWILPEHESELILGITAEDPNADGTEEFKPDVVFAPEGSVTPFVVRLREGREVVSIQVGPFGQIETDDDD